MAEKPEKTDKRRPPLRYRDPETGEMRTDAAPPPTAEPGRPGLIDPAQLKAAFLQVMVDAGDRGLDVTRDQVVAELVNAAGAVHRFVAEAQAAAIVEFFLADEG
jgi:hypothetical protein